MEVKLSAAVPIFTATIKDYLRHQDYDRVNAIAKDFTTYGTGEGIIDKLKRVHGGETEELFKQRTEISVYNTMDIFHSCVKPLNKVGRTPTTIKMEWVGKEAQQNIDNTKKVLELANKFWGNKSVKDYLSTRTGPIDSQDPNSFIVVEFAEQIDSKDVNKPTPKPYPFEVNSKEAINYIFANNELQWIIVLNPSQYKGAENNIIAGEKYYMYITNESITATQVYAENPAQYLADNPEVIALTDIKDFNQLQPKINYLFAIGDQGDGSPEALKKYDKEKRFYIINVFQHKMGQVPAKRFGTELDPLTRNRTCIPVVYPAKSYFEDSIQTLSEFGVVKRLHAFPQKWQYLPKCDNVDCYKGQLKGGGICTKCKGTGTITHESSQDIIGIKMPDDAKDLIDLEKMTAYKTPSIDLIKFQKEFGFEDLRRYAQSAVYNNEVGRRRVKTATETEIDFEAVYDTLHSFADNWSDLYKFIFQCIAALIDLSSGFLIEHKFPDDFQMQTVSEVLDDLKKANDNGAPSHIKKAITEKLSNKIYINHPREILKIDTKDKFYPFPGKTETEIQFILANGKTTKYAATLYSHFDLIFSDLEYDAFQLQQDFYDYPEKMQREKLKAKVQEYITIIDQDAANSAAANFTGGTTN